MLRLSWICVNLLVSDLVLTLLALRLSINFISLRLGIGGCTDEES